MKDEKVHGKVSIIMGIYNCAETLPAAVESILSQTYTNWEIIACDDGSQDETYEIASQYSTKYPEKFFLLRHKKNCGLNITLNDCLDIASGEFIARMDGDDISMPTRLEKEVEFLNKNPQYSIVSCPMIYFDENGEWGKGKALRRPQKEDFVNGTPFCHAPSMTRKEAYLKCGGYSLDKWTMRCEDYDLWGRMYALGYTGANLEEPLYKMRDDRSAFRRRGLTVAINAFITRIRIARLLHLSFWAYIRAIRPVFVALVPWQIYQYLHKRIKAVN